MENIIIKDAYENNLKHIDLEIPVGEFTCVTGCSGCGKSSLVFDTIYAESQRAFLEGMSGSVYGQKLMNKPQVGSIENLRPALNISQNYYNVNPRSTVGTTTEISYYLRPLFAIVNSDSKSGVSEKVFSSNNPKSFCPYCGGIGVERVVSEDLLIPDSDVTLRDGGILFFKGTADSKAQKLLEALCDQYGIDINKKVSELREDELHKLLYANDNIKFKLSYKKDGRPKKNDVRLRGAVPCILEPESKKKSDTPTASTIDSQFTVEVPCHVCGGAKLRGEVLEYKIDGLSYADIEGMELKSLYSWITKYRDDQAQSPKKDALAPLLDSILCKLEALLRLDVGYLSLSRSIPSLSNGERQRVRIAAQLTCSLKGLIYILDEPCKGLHYRDITKIVKASRELIDRGNTVIAIEHNKQYIASSDHVIELGPVGGPAGGYLIREGEAPKEAERPLEFKQSAAEWEYCEVDDINFRNIHGQNARFPVGGITCVTGVSGSGKSTLASVIAKCFSVKKDNTYGTLKDRKNIRRVIQVNQAPIGKTPRSTVVTYLEISSEIRKLFADTAAAKKLKLKAESFSMNKKGGGRCECCLGTGLQEIELNYLPNAYVTCPECGGKRFGEKVLSVEYAGKTIYDVLETPVSELIDVFKDTKKVYQTLKNMIDLGLGYVKLGQMSMSLSGGEAQRVKLAKALSSSSGGKALYILDEPTSGLNDVDIDRFIRVLSSLQQNRETVIIIEHNIEFIAKAADYIIDFGVYGGEEGGKITAQGSPEAVFANEASSLYRLDRRTDPQSGTGGE